jgi:pyruvate/2-oxoglutarate dehydrogenase complex dihydrolipoamide dehydrogenase (E3) component
MATSFDVLIIGTGSAGFSAMEGALSVGASVCVIEKDRFGGECPNYACVPSKAVLQAAKMFRHANALKAYGSKASSVGYDFNAVWEYRKSVVETITGGGEHGDRYIKILDQLGVERRMGEAKFVDANTVEVDGKQLKGKAIIIATGTVDFIPPIPGVEDVPYWGWKEAIQAKTQPKSLSIIGGGPVGCEIATYYASFGTRVTLLQAAPAVLNREDEEISVLAKTALERVGVKVMVGAQIQKLVKRANMIQVETAEQGTITTERLVIATGKRSNVAGLNLEDAGVRLDKRGALATNKQQRTNIDHIFGAGDVDGGMQFTHTAHHEGWVAGYNAGLKALNKETKPAKSNDRVVPRATFINPEVASVGMTQVQVKEKFGAALVGRYRVAALGRAVTENARFGLIKVVAHPKTKKILGAHMIGERAGEVIHEAALAIHLNATLEQLTSMIHAFPTYSEGLKAAAAMATLEN